ncbi:MAG: protoporphyrinogen oxidase [Deltaproteobacteria bacterium]|nr:protoporphyrinogen oxidase [Deltaproteobacteria bacterium]MBN2672365.1 protoporphyrinogen oxidase [Deltaproteobacteria bacterium]
MKKVAIVGGGVSGLAIAYWLNDLGLTSDDLVVLESSATAGGNLQTEKVDGFTIEKGPNGFLDNSPATFTLVEKLGIDDQLLQSNENAARRFIYRAGKLREIQTHPVKFIGSGVLPLSGAARVALEPFQKKGGSETESVFDFAARRIGKDAAELLVAAMVQGVFAGDARKLELKSAFPKMYAMEQQYGSLFKAMIGKARANKRAGKPSGGPAGPGGRLTSFVDGMQTLPTALAEALGAMVQPLRDVVRIQQREHFILSCSDGTDIEAQSVVLANPAWSATRMIASFDTTLAAELKQIYYPAITVVATGYRIAELDSVPQGFGFLVPRNQNVRALGCLWSSSVWNHRAPDDSILLRTMVGGSVDEAASTLSDDEIVHVARTDLESTMGITAIPSLVKVYRHPRAIAQYECGHTARMKRVEKQFLHHPGLFLSGSSYGGISVNHCIEEAPQVAKAVAAYLKI